MTTASIPPAEDVARIPVQEHTPSGDAPVFGGPILDGDRLRLHAAEVASAQPAHVRRLRAGPLRGQFEQVKQSLARAYQLLNAEERARRNAIPAEEWLLDNAHVLAGQVREIEAGLPRGYLVELPRVFSGAMAGYPRIYLACLDYLQHTDTRVDPESLVVYMTGYQTAAPLTIGELWAVPIMLRIGLLRVVSGIATLVAQDTAYARAHAWAEKLLVDPMAMLARLDGETVDAPFLVELLRLLRDQDAAPTTIEWIHNKAASFGAPPDELGRRLHLRRAADQVSIANAITSMRTIDAYEWRKFFERTSIVEQVLREDKRDVYAATDPACRDRYRRAVERVARQSRMSEVSVARKAIALASRHGEGARAHAGYYLEHQGLFELERACRARLPRRRRVARAVLEHPQAFYFSSLAALTGVLLAALWTLLAPVEARFLYVAMATASLVVAASEVALSA